MNTSQPLRLLILGAHPDDAEFHAGGLAAAHVERGNVVKMVSVTDGGAGHHARSTQELRQLRREEARRAGAVLGIEYETWSFPDGSLQPTLPLREQVIREIRQFKPDLILTHRPCDYHPDHRAVGQAVQDASYMVTVPLVLPDVPPLEHDPVVALMCDLFTRPYPFDAQIVRDIQPRLETIVRMLACHASQVFEWLPYHSGILDQVPASQPQRMAWLRSWYEQHIAPRADRFRAKLLEHYGPRGQQVRFVEAYEISEYAGKLADEDVLRLFPETSALP